MLKVRAMASARRKPAAGRHDTHAHVGARRGGLTLRRVILSRITCMNVLRRAVVVERNAADHWQRGCPTRRSPRRLPLPRETVRAHVRSIFVKLNVHDRTAALADTLPRGIVCIGYVAPDSLTS